MLVGVPYSKHSSFTELRDFVMVNPGTWYYIVVFLAEF